MKKINLLLIAIIYLLPAIKSQQKVPLQIIKTFHIASGGGWDYLAVGPVNDWLYVSHGSQVNILNKKNGDSVAATHFLIF